MSETRCTCGAGHSTFGECMRAKGIRVGYCQSVKNLDYTTQKNWDRELDAYQSAKSDGIQPDGTSMSEIRRAVEITEKTGVAYDQMKLSRTDVRTLK